MYYQTKVTVDPDCVTTVSVGSADESWIDAPCIEVEMTAGAFIPFNQPVLPMFLLPEVVASGDN